MDGFDIVTTPLWYVWQVVRYLWLVPQFIFGLSIIGGYIQTFATLALLWYGWKWMPLWLKERTRPVLERALGGVRRAIGHILVGSSVPSQEPRTIVRYEKRSLRVRMRNRIIAFALDLGIGYVIFVHPEWVTWVWQRIVQGGIPH